MTDSVTDQLSPMASIVREFFIDFLSSLVPGFLFTMFTVPMIIATGVVLFPNGFQWPEIDAGFHRFHAEIICLTLVFSYVLGCVFARRDPKVPDQRSAAYIMRRDNADWDRAVIQAPRIPKEEKRNRISRLLSRGADLLARHNAWFSRYLAAKRLSRGEGAQFPYSHLYEYLHTRGLRHLAEHVPWRGSDETIDARSKMFINVLKVRLQFHNHHRCGEIIRNEAHVRMMSSVWYAARLLEQTYLFLALLLLFVPAFRPQVRSDGYWVVSILFLLILGSVGWLRRTILAFLHYQRVREIVYVLETAHTAFKEGQTEIFDDIVYIPRV